MRCKLGQRAGAGELRSVAIRYHRGEERRGVRLIRPRGMKCFGVLLEPLSFRPMPARDGIRRPLRRFVAMTAVTGIGSAELYREIRLWDTEGVIMPPVDDHVGAGRHVTGCTGKGP